jgi:hypothetical protein
MKKRKMTFYIYLPKWDDADGIIRTRNSKYCKKFVLLKDMYYINTEGKKIKYVDTYFAVLSNQKSIK